MNHRDLYIDRIVREVVQRVRAMKGSDCGKGRGVVAKTANGSTASTRELTLTDRVVTLTAIKGRLAGVRRLLLRHDAIVTPSVRDELIQHRVEIVRREVSSDGAGSAKGVEIAEQKQCLLAVVTAHKNTGQWLDRLRGELRWIDSGKEGREEQRLIATIDAIATELGTVTSLRAIVLTDQVPAALCLANRQAGLRAVSVSTTDQGGLLSAVRSVGANLLVLDAKRLRPLQLEALARQFLRIEPCDCPAAYAAKLR